VTSKATAGDILGSVSRALAILDLLADAPRGLDIRAITTHFGMNISTGYHTLNTLRAAGYVLRDPDSGRLTLGHKAARLYQGYEMQLGVAPEIRQIVTELAGATQECVVLSMFRRGQVVIAEVTDSTEHLRVGGHNLGPVGDLHARAVGKAFLACMDSAFVERHVTQHPLRAITKNTLTTLEAVQEDLARVRERGYSLDLEELNEGVRALGAAFISWSGEPLGALAVTAPAARFEAKRETLAALVKAAAESVTATLRK
jgi:IclR family acetate operon transcriptional repressor